MTGKCNYLDYCLTCRIPACEEESNALPQDGRLNQILPSLFDGPLRQSMDDPVALLNPPMPQIDVVNEHPLDPALQVLVPPSPSSVGSYHSIIDPPSPSSVGSYHSIVSPSAARSEHSDSTRASEPDLVIAPATAGRDLAVSGSLTSSPHPFVHFDIENENQEQDPQSSGEREPLPTTDSPGAHSSSEGNPVQAAPLAPREQILPVKRGINLFGGAFEGDDFECLSNSFASDHVARNIKIEVDDDSVLGTIQDGQDVARLRLHAPSRTLNINGGPEVRSFFMAMTEKTVGAEVMPVINGLIPPDCGALQMQLKDNGSYDFELAFHQSKQREFIVPVSAVNLTCSMYQDQMIRGSINPANGELLFKEGLNFQRTQTPPGWGQGWLFNKAIGKLSDNLKAAVTPWQQANFEGSLDIHVNQLGFKREKNNTVAVSYAGRVDHPTLATQHIALAVKPDVKVKVMLDLLGNLLNG